MVRSSFFVIYSSPYTKKLELVNILKHELNLEYKTISQIVLQTVAGINDHSKSEDPDTKRNLNDLLLYVKSGEILSIELISWVLERFFELNKDKTFILDGIPRDTDNITFLDSFNAKCHGCIYIKSSDDVIKEKLMNEKDKRGDFRYTEKVAQQYLDRYHKVRDNITSYFRVTGRCVILDDCKPIEELAKKCIDEINMIYHYEYSDESD